MANGSTISYNGGTVGIGTTSPTAILTLDSASTTGTILRISNSSAGGHIWDLLSTGSANTNGAGRLDLYDYTAGVPRLSITSNGYVGVGTTSPSATFAVNGSEWVSGFYNTSSQTGGYEIDGNPIFQSSSTLADLFVGQGAGNTTTTGTDNTAIGFQAGSSLTVPASGANPQADTFLGWHAGANVTTARESTFIGFNAGGSATGSGGGVEDGINTAVGSFAGSSITTGADNVMLGQKAGLSVSTSSSNIMIGTHGAFSMVGNTNVVIGTGAGQAGSGLIYGDSNILLGYQVASPAVGGSISNNTVIGNYAGNALQTASNNVFLGASSGQYDTSGLNNTFIGTASGYNNTTGSNNVVIGYNITVASSTQNNQLNIDNLITGNTSGGWLSLGANVGIGTTTPQAALHLANSGGPSGGLLVTDTTNVGPTGGIYHDSYSTHTTIFDGNNGGPGIDFKLFTSGVPSNVGAYQYKATFGENIFGGSNYWGLSGSHNNGENFSVLSDNSLNLFSASGYAIRFLPGGNNASAPIMVASSTGIAIGTTTPSARLTVWGPDTASTSAFAVVNNASTTVFSVFDNGNSTYSGSIFQSSDQRLKTDVTSLDASSSLSAIEALNPVSYLRLDQPGTGENLGFIAQQVQSVFPQLVSTTSPTALTPDGTLTLNYTGLISPIVAAIQELASEIASLENTVAGFAQSFSSHFIHGDTVEANQLCVKKADGTDVCITGDQLAAVLAGTSQQSSGSGASSGASSNGLATDTPPTIQLNGSNPATIQVGTTYSDPGATITGPQADLNLGIQTYLNGSLMNPVQIDTSKAATDTVSYVVTDQNGLTSTSTRTVIIQALPDPQSSAAASTTTTATSTTE